MLRNGIKGVEMDEGKIAADFATEFVKQNINVILGIGKKTFDNVNETLQIKLRTAYTNYLTNVREKYSKSKSFFIRNESVDLYSYYVPTGIKCGKKNITSPSFSKCLKNSKNIVITGTGGSGKTILMKHLFLDCIKDKKYTPILLELRELDGEKNTLDEFIELILEKYGFNISGDFIKRAKEAGHLCFFFDGYDEVNQSQRIELLKQIKSLSSKYPDCPIFISSRPDDLFKGIDDFSIYKILPLGLNSANDLIAKLPFDEQVKNKFITDLSNGLFEQHKSFLSNPLLISIMLLTYGENAEIPAKLSIFYNQAYETLFQRHDANKGGYSRHRLTTLDILDFSRVFSLFALQTYEKHLFKMSRTDCLGFIEKSRESFKKDFKSEDFLTDLLSAACLLIEDGLEIAFSHRSFQEYFVAIYITSASPEIQEKLIERYWENIQSENIIGLLCEIDPELVERLLMIPKLEMIFSIIGVKNKIGVTHVAKYIKYLFSEIQIEQGKVSAILYADKISLSSVVDLSVKHCQTYCFPGKNYFEKRRAELAEKYGNGDNSLYYTTDEMSYRTPILADVISSKGAFSVEYLQSALDAFTILKLKHENKSQNLDELLGI